MLRFLVGFCFGQLPLHLLCLLTWWLCSEAGVGWREEWGGACFHLFMNGFLFLVGYLGSVMASAAFGISVGYPISQSALVVAGLWSVFYFKEIQGDSLIAGFFVACGLIVLGGVGLKLS